MTFLMFGSFISSYSTKSAGISLLVTPPLATSDAVMRPPIPVPAYAVPLTYDDAAAFVTEGPDISSFSISRSMILPFGPVADAYAASSPDF